MTSVASEQESRRRLCLYGVSTTDDALLVHFEVLGDRRSSARWISYDVGDDLLGFGRGLSSLFAPGMMPPAVLHVLCYRLFRFFRRECDLRTANRAGVGNGEEVFGIVIPCLVGFLG
jgi:hypothetical protein